VTSRDSDVDPVGACVGMKGSRVQAVVQELRGEKIDIVPWDSEASKFICNALAPAEIIRVIVDEDNHTMEVVVPDDQLSLAIGKRGQNVRLASKLSGWHLDVTSETNYNKALKDAYDSLLQIEGVGEKTALDLYQSGYKSSREVAEAKVSDILQMTDMDEEKAEKIVRSAIALSEAGPSPESGEEDQGIQEEQAAGSPESLSSAGGEGAPPAAEETPGPDTEGTSGEGQ
jgi:N utilization substance protein A